MPGNFYLKTHDGVIVRFSDAEDIRRWIREGRIRANDFIKGEGDVWQMIKYDERFAHLFGGREAMTALISPEVDAVSPSWAEKKLEKKVKENKEFDTDMWGSLSTNTDEFSKKKSRVPLILLLGFLSVATLAITCFFIYSVFMIRGAEVQQVVDEAPDTGVKVATISTIPAAELHPDALPALTETVEAGEILAVREISDVLPAEDAGADTGTALTEVTTVVKVEEEGITAEKPRAGSTTTEKETPPQTKKEAKVAKGDYDSLMEKGNAMLGSEPEKALSVFQLASQRYPNRAEPVAKIGFCYLNMGNPKEAALSFQKALVLNVDYSPAYIGLARAHKKLGNSIEAKMNYKEYLKRNPQGQYAGEAKGYIGDEQQEYHLNQSHK